MEEKDKQETETGHGAQEEALSQKKKPNRRPSKALDLALIAMFAVLIAACSWITVPGPVPFTLQTFGVACALGFLGGKRGTVSVLIYMLLGAVGLPVFAGFSGGFGVLFGATGGYILGFLFMGLAYWLITYLFGEKNWSMIAGLIVGLILCYAFGTAWFTVIFTRDNGPMTFAAALMTCVVPFLLPDALKLGLAFGITKLLKKRVRIFSSYTEPGRKKKAE